MRFFRFLQARFRRLMRKCVVEDLLLLGSLREARCVYGQVEISLHTTGWARG